eukprot:4846809-Prymnesium_polylepis.1
MKGSRSATWPPTRRDPVGTMQHPRRGTAPPPARCGYAPRSAAAMAEGKQVSPRPVTLRERLV